MESSSASYSIDIARVIFAAVLLALSMTLVIGGVIGYRKSKATVERVFVTIGIAGGAIILITLLLGGFELLLEPAVMPLLFSELGLLGMLFWVWMLVDCAVNESSAGNDKLVWVIIVLFTHVIGPPSTFSSDGHDALWKWEDNVPAGVHIQASKQ